MSNMTTPEAIHALCQELKRARAKFPSNAKLFEALGEEVGELGRAFKGDGDIPAEAIQVACVAIRIATEGTTVPNEGVVLVAEALEKVSRRALGDE